MTASPTILLVEDNPDDEKLTIRALSSKIHNHSILVARDGEEALNMLLKTDKLPKVVLLDLKLPKIDGLEVLKRIRGNQKTQWLPVVVLTSSSEEQDIVASYRLQANCYVRKPIDFDRFNQVISQVGQFWMTINESLPEKF